MNKSTETLINHSQRVAQHRSTEYSSDLYYSETTLYKHRDGRHFTYHRGGAGITSGVVKWISDDEAKRFADEHTLDPDTHRPVSIQNVLDKCTAGGTWTNGLNTNDFNYREITLYRHESGAFYLLEGRDLKQIREDQARHFITRCASDGVTGYTYTDEDFDDFVAGRSVDRETQRDRTRQQSRSPIQP